MFVQYVLCNVYVVYIFVQINCWTPEEACNKLSVVRPHVLIRAAQRDMLHKYYQQVCVSDVGSHAKNGTE